jgi:hypothetical protein
MTANGATEHKSLADYAASKQNGTSAQQKYPVSDQNYGYNVLGCSNEVQLTFVPIIPCYDVISLVSEMCSYCPVRCRNGEQGLT